MNKPVNSTRRAIALSSFAIGGWGSAATTLPRDVIAQTPADLDSRVKAFLDQRRNTWSQGINYWNVRYEDGQALHDLVLKNGFKRLLEVGTSTGHYDCALRLDRTPLCALLGLARKTLSL